MSEPVARASDLAAAIAALGNEFTPEVLARTIELYAPAHERAPFPDVQISRDLQYGPDARHRLDVFTPATPSRHAAPVLLFVHGGGFVGGDKVRAGLPFYENVGAWAVRHGMIGVTMTYRLAPAHPWPAGSEDVSAAVRWLRENIAAHGGVPARIFVMGQSAGATHVAGFIAREYSGEPQEWQPAGAILLSGLYDSRTMERNPFFLAYFGKDEAAYEQQSMLESLARTRVPLLVAIAEFDPPDFLRQCTILLEAYLRSQQRLPRLVQLIGHNHLSTVLQLNLEESALSAEICRFAKVQR